MKKNNVKTFLMKNNRASRMTIAALIMSLLLSASCVSQNKKQASTIKGGPGSGEGGVDQEIECRWYVPTGSTLRQKTCASKAEWEKIDQGGKRDADRFFDDVVDEMRQNRTDFEEQ